MFILTQVHCMLTGCCMCTSTAWSEVITLGMQAEQRQQKAAKDIQMETAEDSEGQTDRDSKR